MVKKIYFDYAATTPPHSEVVKVMLPYSIDAFGNPSSIYSYGQEAKGAIEEARIKVATLINALDEEVIFTSGGTEANNFALEGVAYANESRGNHIITSSIEHHAVIETCKFLESRGFSLTYLPVDAHGLVDPEDVKMAITNKTILISVMHANNEIGSIEPIIEIGKIAKEADVCFHTDAVQTVGHIPVLRYHRGSPSFIPKPVLPAIRRLTFRRPGPLEPLDIPPVQYLYRRGFGGFVDGYQAVL
jgi:cysteine desulfurase